MKHFPQGLACNVVHLDTLLDRKLHTSSCALATMQDCGKTEFLQTPPGSTLGQQDKSHIKEANPSHAPEVSVH